MKKTAAVLCAAMLTLTACGSSDDDQAKENIKASVLEDNAEVVGDTKLTDEQAECFADGMVDDIGVEKLQDYNLINDDFEIVQDAEPTDMSKGDAEAMAAVITGCVDMKQMIEDQINEQAGTDLTEEQAQCVSDAIDEDAIEAGLAASFQGDEETNPLEESMGALMQCVMGGTGEMELE
jgi:hypothetical protein